MGSCLRDSKLRCHHKTLSLTDVARMVAALLEIPLRKFPCILNLHVNATPFNGGIFCTGSKRICDARLKKRFGRHCEHELVNLASSCQKKRECSGEMNAFPCLC